LSAGLQLRLESGPLLRGVGARDALEARLIEEWGFDFIWVGSLAVAASFGLPDTGVVPREKVLGRVAEIRAAVNLPIIWDSDLGYEPLDNVAQSIQALEYAGANGVSIEDKVWPENE